VSQTLRDRRALVTGGSRGIGAAIVRRLAREGAHVALTYVSRPDRADETAKAAQAFGVRALAIRADSADAGPVVAAVERAAAELGGLDILVNNAERMPFPGGAVYAMSKAALVGLVKGLARDLGRRGITINNVQPGPIDTDMNPADSEVARMLRDQILALPRYGTVDEIAAMVAYLAGPEAGFVTGASLTIDGGFTA